MTQYRPNTLLRTTALCASLMLPAAAMAGEITLTGEGEVRYQPDSVELAFTARAEHATPEQASAAVKEDLRQWRTAIEPYREDLTGYSDSDTRLYTRQITPRDNKAEPETVTVVSQTVRFEVNDLTLLNPLLDHAQDIGLQYNLSSGQFFHSQEKQLERQALAKAIDDARDECAFIARQLDQECADVVSLTVNDQHRPVRMMSAEASGARSDTIESVGPRTIRTRVNATFELD